MFLSEEWFSKPQYATGGFREAKNMKMRFPIRGKKGQIHTLEAVMAVIIMIIFAFSVLQFYSIPTYEAQSVEELKERGKSAITALDESGNLEEWVSNDDYDDLETALTEMLPRDVAFNLTVFSDSLGGTVEGSAVFGGVTAARSRRSRFQIAWRGQGHPRTTSGSMCLHRPRARRPPDGGFRPALALRRYAVS